MTIDAVLTGNLDADAVVDGVKGKIRFTSILEGAGDPTDPPDVIEKGWLYLNTDNNSAWSWSPDTETWSQVSALQSAGALTFLYDPGGVVNTTPVFNDWADVMTAVDDVRHLHPTIYLKSTTADGALYSRRLLTVPAGVWNFERLRFCSADGWGVTLLLPDGVNLSGMHELIVDRNVVLRFAGLNAQFGPAANSQTVIELHNSGCICAEGAVEPIRLTNDNCQLVFILDREGGLYNGQNVAGEAEGTIEIALATGTNCLFFITAGQKTVMTDNLFAGTAAYAYRVGSTSVRKAHLTHANLTISYDISATITQAAALGYSNTTSGLDAENAQDAIDELKALIDAITP